MLRWIPSQRILDFLSQYLNNILEGLHFELRAVKETGEMTYPGDVQQNLLAALSCPACLAEHAQDGSPDPGKLQAVENGRWLVCQDAYCGRKYPVADGLPVLTSKEGKRWQAYAVKELPEPPEDYTCIRPRLPPAVKSSLPGPPETIDRHSHQLQRKRSLAASAC